MLLTGIFLLNQAAETLEQALPFKDKDFGDRALIRMKKRQSTTEVQKSFEKSKSRWISFDDALRH